MRGDVSGAVAAALVSLPLSMTIGVVALAPLGKEYAIQGVMAGLFGAIVLSLVAALLGARSVLISGPRAASALILASLITQLFVSDELAFPSGETLQHVISIAYFAILLAGVIQLLGGLLRIGSIVKYIPYPVIAGFVNSSALLIIMGQSWVLLDIRKQGTFMDEDSFIDLLMRLNEAQPLTMIPGLAAIAVMILVGRHLKSIPASLAGMAAGTGVYYAMKSFMKGVDIGATIGSISKQAGVAAQPETFSILPSVHVTELFTGLAAGGDLGAVLVLVIPAALSMAVLSSLDTAVSLSALDDLTDSRTDFNRELVGHGAGNMVSAMLGGLIGAGGMVRTKPGYDAGGKTVAMTVMTSVIMLLAVVLFVRYIEYIPRAVIAGMIIVIGFQIFDRWSLSLLKSCCSRYLFKRTSTLVDAVVIVLVIAVALSFGLIIAVGVGTLISIIIFVSRMSKSLIRNIYHGPAIRARNVWDSQSQALLETNGHKIAVLELEGSIFFGTAGNLEAEIDRLILGGVAYVVLDTKRVNDIDSTGCLVLQRIQARLRRHGGELAISYILRERRNDVDNFPGQDQRRQGNSRFLWMHLKNAGAVEILGEDIFFPDTDGALTRFEEQLINSTRSIKQSTTPTRLLPAILETLLPNEIRTLRRLATRHVFEKGAAIFKQGDAGDAIFYVSKGRANIFLNLQASGEVKRLHSVMSGTVFGEMAVLDNRPRAASVIATETTICYRLGIDQFEQIKSIHNETALKLFNNICLMFSDRIRSANTMIEELEK